MWQQEVACPYASAGCNDRVVRKDLQGHVQSQTQKHLQLISDRLTKMAQLQVCDLVIIWWCDIGGKWEKNFPER